MSSVLYLEYSNAHALPDQQYLRIEAERETGTACERNLQQKPTLSKLCNGTLDVA